MSRSDWIKYAKIVGLAAATFIIVFGLYLVGYFSGRVSGYYGGKADYTANQYPGDTKRNVNDCFDLPSRPEISECVAEAIKTSRENQRSEQDLSAQRDMSEWAWWSMTLGILQFFATIITLGFVKLTLDATLKAVEATGQATGAMVEANKIAQAAHNAAVRPWLSLAIKPGRLRIIGNELRLGVKITAHNFGQSPAREVRIRAGLFIPDGNGNQPQILDHFIVQGPELKFRGLLIMPGQSVPSHRVASCKIVEFGDSIFTPKIGACQVGLLVGIDYVDGYSQHRHQTYLGHYLTRDKSPKTIWDDLFLVFYPNTKDGEIVLRQFEGGIAT